MAIWLQAGAVRAVGEVSTVVSEYRARMHSETMDVTPPQLAGADGEATGCSSCAATAPGARS